MAAYEYKVKGLYSVPAQVAGELFEKLEASDTGLTPQAVVDASRPEDAPLHNEFEWRDDVAAEKYRCEQARKMINVVIVKSVDRDEEEETGKRVYDRAFVSTPDGIGSYHSLHTTLNNEVWKAHLLMSAKREMEQFIAKYRQIEELAGVVSAISDYLQVG